MIPHSWKFLDTERKQINVEGDSALFDNWTCERCGLNADVQAPWDSELDIDSRGHYRGMIYWTGPGEKPALGVQDRDGLSLEMDDCDVGVVLNVFDW